MATSPDVVISQAYGGGGNSGSVYKNDFIELFNRSSAPVSLAGWTVQYASSTGSSWSTTALSGTIPAYSYYLVQEAAGSAGTTSLPTPDATGTIAMAGGGFKVAVCNTTAALSGSNPIGSAQLVDFVGAAANAFEGSAAAPAPSNANSVMRANNGCTDSDNNASDFTSVAANPRNSTAPVNNCGGGPSGFVRVETLANGTGVVVPAQSLVAGSSLTVYAIQRDANTNFVANVAADSWALTKSGSVAATDLAPAGDLKSAVLTGHGAGTAIITANSSLGSTVSSGTITVTASTPTQVRVETAADGNGAIVPAQTIVSGHGVTMYAIRRDVYTNFVDNVAASSWSLSSKTGSVLDSDLAPAGDLKSATFIGNGQGTATVHAASAALPAVDSGLLTITSLPPATVVISQVYGGGGNSGATFTQDFVELFNRSANPVSLNGWSIQYTSSQGTSFASSSIAALPNVSIPGYSYYLVGLSNNTAGAGGALPTVDFTAQNINMSQSDGKIVLANTATALGVATWPDSRILDMVGYGGANNYEGTGPAPTLSSTLSAQRNNAGCTDTDNNNTDFAAATPSPRNSASGINTCPSQTPPTISIIGNQSEDAAAPIGPISFDVNDAQTPAANLTVSATSSNPTLLPVNQITFGGSGIVRNVTLHPASGQTGSSQVTVTVTDSDNQTASTSFNLFVGGGPALGIVFTENFDEYSDGTSLSQSPISPWFHTSGTNYELIVSNFAAQVSLYLTNSEDINASFPSGPFTANSGTVLYVGFTLKQTSLPGANGDYFLHLRDVTGTNFAAKVFASTGNAGSGKFRLGVSNRANNPPNVQFPLDLSLNATYNVVVRYKIGVASSTIWVNPVSVNDTGATASDTATPFDVTGIGIRESGSPTTPTTAGSQVLDNMIVSTSFSDVTTFPSLPPTITAVGSAGAITLTWPTNNYSGFVLQSASTVNATTWNPVAGVSVAGTNYTVTVPFTSTPAYFRLKQ